VTFGRIGLFAAAGLSELRVSRQPRVGLLATGNELVESGRPLQPGQIYESNRAMLAELVKRAGARPEIFPLVPDTMEATRAALENALARCDAAITTGGVSVGEFDFVKAAFEQMGGELNLWRVAIKPGKPFVFGRAGGKLLFGLPGNPVSALVTFLLLAHPALARMQGAGETGLSECPGMLTGPLTNPADRRHFMHVVQDRAGRVRSAGAQASHLLSSIACANGLVDVPPHTTLASGATVTVLRWDR
jgi:molybdopterin molybdotransferase